MAKYDVFLSYSRGDMERVAPLRDELRRMGAILHCLKTRFDRGFAAGLNFRKMVGGFRLG